LLFLNQREPVRGAGGVWQANISASEQSVLRFIP
jgi:hypothetical protein